MPFRRLRIFHKIAAHGVLLLLAIAASAILAFHIVETSSRPTQALKRMARVIRKNIEATDGTEQAIRETLRPFQYVINSPIGVFRPDGIPIVELSQTHIPPLSRGEYENMKKKGRPYHRKFAEVAFPLKLSTGPAYLFISWHHADRMRWRFVVVVLIFLVVIGLMSIPVARSIAKPVKMITETAAQLRDGNLQARAKVESSDELAVLARTLNDMAEGLERRIKREKELLANVSHELRTPLARIQVALEIAAEAVNDPAVVTTQLSEISTDIVELDQLVGDVLVSTRLDFSPGSNPAQFPLNRKDIRMAPFLEASVSRFEANNGCRIHRDFEAPNSTAPIDDALIRRVIDNLLGNSLKYSGDEADISLSQRESNGNLIIEVKDRGMGVSEENLERLFEPFFRTEKSRNRDAGGMGLGLTLAKRIVEAHGGRIFAKAREGGGLTVTIELPLTPRNLEPED